MSLLRNASGIMPLAVRHLSQTEGAASADQPSTAPHAGTSDRLWNVIATVVVSSLVLAIMAALIAAMSVSGQY